ncbi:hypothetical protein QYE76_015655 [Lolium multiflorum]|uniref:Arabidopsis retrotransposon Orf1 C-terminal domain-containing protein n=1 Tax=Lolium multiflorum TaxID=4521 RepID=A0AAD8X6L1_LOLMU|nr:hypothetical protein QYE76_015655 [Lolium multiflorum]
MDKPRDTKIAILPSTTRKGTTLSTSAALDSPSVISKLVSPPQTSNAGTSAESENSSHNCDDASAVLDNDGSLGSFLDATIAKSRQIKNTETPNENAATPVNSPESVEYSSDDLDEDYVELDDDFIENCNATTDARKIKKLLAEHADPLYPEGHPKRVEQDSQLIKTSAPSKKKKKKHKNVVESSEPVNDPNSISISDAETESGNEHEEDNDKNDTPDKEEVEKEPEKHAKNKKKMKKFKFGELFKKATTSTGRPSRASTQIRRSYNEDVIAPSFAPEEDNGAPNASSFPCYEFLTNAGIFDDFFTLVNRAGLATYVGDEREQYYRLTKIFVESFKFHNTQFEPTDAFKIYDIPVTMKLEEFCRALDIAPVGTARRIDDNPRDLLELYRGITEDDCRTIQRGKIRNIQLPAIKYFAYYIATSILGRENTSNISSYHLAFLNVALTGETSYHLGSLIACRLSSRGPIFGGTIALRILTHLEIPLDSNDVPLTPRRLDIAAMKSHHFVTTDSTIDNMVYRMLFADGNEKEIPLPQPGLFNIDRQSWSLTKEAVEEHMKIQEFHQQHDSENAEPSYDYTVTYPDVSSSTYLEPGRSSSYYEDTTSWGPWNELHLGQKPKLGGARTAQEFQLDEPANDSLLDALSLLEVHGSEARGGIDQAKAGLSRLFPYFFPKKEEPATFLDLAKCFNPSEDLGLRVRHENMKIAVENTVALVADSQQSIDWSKVGDTDQIEQSRWRSLIKAAKPNTRKILAYIEIKPSSTPSSSKPEV